MPPTVGRPRRAGAVFQAMTDALCDPAWTAVAATRPWAPPVWLEPGDGADSPHLPRQPIPPGARQRRLARTYLGDLDGLHALLQELRLQADEELAPRLPSFAGKLYPLGRCLEIRDAVFAALVARIQQPDSAATRALHGFIAEGGVGGKIWGVLRESYFQNAIQLGPLYVDVANDTVTVTKPKIEILPMESAGMVPVASLAHFATIARRYWGVEIYRNTVFPALAPYYPMICVSETGAAWIEPGSGQVTTLIRRQRMMPALRFLSALALPPDDRVRALYQIKSTSTDALIRAEGDPVAMVEQARAQGRYRDPAYLAACRASRDAIIAHFRGSEPTKPWNLDGPP